MGSSGGRTTGHVHGRAATEGDTMPLLCGFLTERITAALLEEQVAAVATSFAMSEDGDDAAMQAAMQAAAERPTSRVDFNALEARLRRELTFIGLLEDPSKVWGA